MTKYYNASIRNLTYRLRRFKEILDENLMEIVLSHQDEIVEAIQNQMYSGWDGYMKQIQPPYTATTARIKLRKGQPINRVTLYDTGKFYNSFRVEVDSGGFRIIATDPKTDKLTTKYGESIFKLSDANLKWLIQNYFRPELQERMKQYLLNK